ncbi:uncharacterized protein [Dendrobates tinctorius]|uniref:uncharacterized protein n=1 Tax=Dendrobates tinctorius TaxID=92724 RepID=UPI003CC9EF4F
MPTCTFPFFLRIQKFLRFAINGRHFQFAALPFGIATAPRVFMKVMAVMMAVLHSRGIVVLPYLDDLLGKGPSFRACKENVSITLDTLSRLGWLVNRKKSSLVPARMIVFLGMVFNTSQGLVSLPQNKALALQQGVLKLQQPVPHTIRFRMRILGKMVAAMEAIPFAQFHLRPPTARSVSLGQESVHPRSAVPAILSGQAIAGVVDDQILPSSGEAFSPRPLASGHDRRQSPRLGSVFLPPHGTRPVVATGSSSSDKLVGNTSDLAGAAAFPVPPSRTAHLDTVRQRHSCGLRKSSGGHAQQGNHARDSTGASLGREEPVDNFGSLLPRRRKLGSGLPQPTRGRGWGMGPAPRGLPANLPTVGNTGCGPDGVQNEHQGACVRRSVTRPTSVRGGCIGLTMEPVSPSIPVSSVAIASEGHQEDQSRGGPSNSAGTRLARRVWYADLVRLLTDVPWRLPERPDLLHQGPIFHPNSGALCLTAWPLNLGF